MKLVSLNMEGTRHIDRIVPFLEQEQPDVIALMEAPDFFAEALTQMGYTTTFAPMVIRIHPGQPFKEGVLFASKHLYKAETEYYHRCAATVTEQLPHDQNNTCSQPVIVAQVTINEQIFQVATTHSMVTPDGLPHALQRTSIATLLQILDLIGPHVLCGDFNMPRGYNNQYKLFTAKYTDTIPAHYGSSLDKTLHRLGTKPTEELNAPIFDTYMVDYLFTQPPYTAHNVRLQFGLSDHAAVVADISLNRH